MKTEDFAQAVLKAVEIREESFDHKMADRMNRSGFPDYKQCYKLSIDEATDKAIKELKIDPRMSQPIFLLLYCSWNDSLAWANDIEAFEEEAK